jgi:23S rRNA maturation-related 3'-5' exoribonuclease YhaM
LQKKTRIQEIVKTRAKSGKYKKARHRGDDDSHHATMGKLSHQARRANLIYF